MTVTDPERALVEAPDESILRAPVTWVALVGRSLFGAVTAVAISVAIGLIGLEGSYAGARKDVAAEQAISAYESYLSTLLQSLVWVGLVEALVLAPAVLGLLLLVRSRTRHTGWFSEPRLVPLLCGVLAVFACFVGIAHRYPGLFLSLLASNRLLTLCARWGHLIAALVFGAAALGYGVTLYDSRSPRVRFGCAAALLASVVVYLGVPLVPGPVRVFRNSALAAAPVRASELPNVLVLAVDSLRPDMIDPAHTPHLSSLIGQSIYFPNTLVTQPRTGPSWAAALTSLPPLRNGIETMFPDAGLSAMENFALPAHLSALGYRTAVFSEYAGEFFTRAKFGFQVTAVPEVELREIAGQMLMMRLPVLLGAASVLYAQGPLGRAALGERLTNLMRGMPNFASPGVLEDDMLALSTLDRANAGGGKPAPYFWLAFYSQPHFPYTSSSDFYPHYEVPGSAAELRFGRDAANEIPIACPEDRQQLVGLYRAALAETDRAIGKLLARLDAQGQLDQTIIVLLADHGEGLYECPTCVGHGDNLKSMITLRVPLAFRLPAARYPRAAPSRNDAYVSQLDLYPTISSLLGRNQQAHHEGIALLGADGAALPVPPRDHFAESGEWLWPTPAVPEDRIRYPLITKMAKVERGRIVIESKYNPEIRAGKHRAVIRPPYKLSYQPGATDVEYHLHQFEHDPLEIEDLTESNPKLVTELKRALFRSMVRHPQILPVGDYFLSRPEPPPPEKY